MGMKACIFCEIVSGRKDAARVFEDTVSVAFLDHRPLFPGHVLLVPRQHLETLADLPSALLPQFFTAVQLLAAAVERGTEAQGSFVAVNNRVSQSVPHLHVHIVPRRRGDGLRGFFWPRQAYDGPEHASRLQEAIQEALRVLQRRGGP